MCEPRLQTAAVRYNIYLSRCNKPAVRRFVVSRGTVYDDDIIQPVRGLSTGFPESRREQRLLNFPLLRDARVIRGDGGGV